MRKISSAVEYVVLYYIVALMTKPFLILSDELRIYNVFPGYEKYVTNKWNLFNEVRVAGHLNDPYLYDLYLIWSMSIESWTCR